jgi:hypothetical protein
MADDDVDTGALDAALEAAVAERERVVMSLLAGGYGKAPEALRAALADPPLESKNAAIKVRRVFRGWLGLHSSRGRTAGP